MFAAAAFSLTAAVITAGGCASAPARPVNTDAQLRERAAANQAYMVDAVKGVAETLTDRVWKRMQAAKAGEDITINFLAISGGGDYGAFGAGLLVGWGQATDPAWRRPDFDIVTGVSTGALLAPFAFVDTDEACQSVESFYRNPHADWVQERGLFFFMPSNPSFMTIQNLEHSLKDAVSDAMISQIAARARDGRVLAVSATDLDFGKQHVWNLGLVAEKIAAGGNPDSLRRILLASAAIPVAFPPIEIGGSLYSDGGVTANVFVRLDPKSPGGFLQTWKRKHPDAPFPKVRYWIIVNNSLSEPPRTVQAKWPEVLSPSLATSIRSATIAEMRWLAAETDFVNATMHTDIEVRVTAIPDDWRPPVEGEFKKETMNSLADVGRKMGADPSSWSLWAAPNH